MNQQHCPIVKPLILCLGLLQGVVQAQQTLPLDGTWRFQLDASNVGVEQKWFNNELGDSVQLPGTTDTNKKGNRTDDHPDDKLSRIWRWVGPAWYQREVTIPESWEGKRITVFLERTKNTRVWVNDRFAGFGDSLSAPHVHDLTDFLKPGKQTITLLIDNAKLPPVGPSHAVDERTQTNWNGVVGKMELRASDPVWIDDLQVFPNAAKNEARVRVVVGNRTGTEAKGTISLSCNSYNVDKPAAFKAQRVDVVAAGKETVVEFTYKPGEEVPLWDEFNPALLKLDLVLEAKSGAGAFHDTTGVNFGMRDFTHERNRFKINGKGVVLRGRIDCANYPLTGYAPMTKEEWRRIYSILKDWGLNHVRFHSWCPPKAAFEAADELGFYLLAELPNKRSAFKSPEDGNAAAHNIDYLDIESSDKKVDLYDYAMREATSMFRHFGNHPSYIMFTLGNETGRGPAMYELTDHLRKINPRPLYALGTNNRHWDPELAEGDQFWIIKSVKKHSRLMRGSTNCYDDIMASIEDLPPGTLDDLSDSIEGVEVPLIGHETGQFQVYPRYGEIEKFKGVLEARNYQIFRDRIKEAGMLDQADDFVRASGALAALCYREDIELALRTPGIGGFQLLDIMDFPGQGTALVGMLDVFMDSKGIIEPEAWRRYCSATVPLIRMKQHVWTSDESFIARAEVAHYGPEDIKDAKLTWTLTDTKGHVHAKGNLAPMTLPQGELSDVDMFSFSLKDIPTPQRLDLTLEIEGTNHRNSYPIWVYAPEVDTKAPEDVMVSRKFEDPETQSHLAKGGKVLLLPKPDELPHSVPPAFQTDFWSPMFTKGALKSGIRPPPGTMGILCDPKTPALADFPTEFHSNWQWWHLVKHARPIILDGTPKDYHPVVQVIDNIGRNHKLGLVAETKVGQGRMLVCSIDLPGLQDRPEARQMLHSLLNYMKSSDFSPDAELDTELLKKLLP